MPGVSNPNPNRRVWPRLLLVLAGLAGLVFLLTWFYPASRPSAPSRPGESAGGPANKPAAAEPAAGRAGGVTLGLRKGDRLVYEFSQKRSVQLQGSSFGGIVAKGATNASVAMHIAQAGDLVVKVYDETGKGWPVGFSVEGASVKVSTGNKVASSDSTEAGLRSEVLAFVEKSGRIGKMTAPTNTSPETLNQWRDILSRWQTVLDSDPAVRTWKRTEEDETGTYVAVYSRETDQSPASVRKQKAKYLSVSGSTPKGFESRCRIKGGAVIQLGPYPIRIEGQEQLSFQTPEIGGSIDSEAEYSFHLRSAAQDSEVEAWGPERARQLAMGGTPFSWVSTSAASGQPGSVDVSHTTIQEQIAALEQVLAAGKSGTQDEVKALANIVALIKNDDASVGAIANYLATPDVLKNMELSSALIGMLGAAGTPKSQEMLMSIASNSTWPLEQRQMAMTSFVQVTEPTPAVDGWLQQLHQQGGELANNALLVLAAMGNRVQEQNPDRFSQISQYVIGAASVSGLALNEQVVGLDAIGNLGPHEVPQVVQEDLTGNNAVLRERALQSLQRMDPEITYPLIQSALQSDSDANVRAAAASLLGNAQMSGGCDALCQAALHDTSSSVRTAAVQSLAEWMSTNPEASRVLQQVSSQDASQTVRNAANQALLAPHGLEAGEAVAATATK